MDGVDLRGVILESVKRNADSAGAFNCDLILRDLESYRREKLVAVDEQAALTAFYDLFRNGYLSWGMNFNNPKFPWCHLTAQGRAALSRISRDPANPDGYLSHLHSAAKLPPDATPYIEEALRTFNSQCFKAAAVMLGVASEVIVLSVRDSLVSRMKALGQSIPADLSNWRIRRVLDAVQATLTRWIGTMPKPLGESFGAYWPAITQQIRVIRNDAGHPGNIAPVQEDSVHASLLLFPVLAKLGTELREWIANSYT